MNKKTALSDRPQSVSLQVEGRDPVALPLLDGSCGPSCIDVTTLGQEGFFTYDNGFSATAACRSAITYIDGDAGVLLHRGYPIESLAENADYPELCYLLLHGELPKEQEWQEFTYLLKRHTMVHEQIHNFFNGFPRSAHPMAILCGVMGAMSAFYHENLDLNSERERLFTAIRLIAKMPTLAAMSYKYSIGQPFMYPDNSLPFAENFLQMMFGVPCEETAVNPVCARAMDCILLLHADHEQNASTSAVRMAGSTGANPYACVAAGIAALWGKAHGGANEAVLQMLREIGDEEHIGRFIKRAQDKNDPFRLMGFGHRVYKNFDPRAKVIRNLCHEVLEAVGVHNDPFFRVARKLEEIALQDDYFIEKKLYPNVDFYSGIVLRALNIPTSMLTVIFTTGRIAGWIAHWKEMYDQGFRISRPRHLYIGPQNRSFVPRQKR